LDADRIEFAQVHAAAASAPDWSVVTHDLHCPLCEYNLRGLIEPRCPECGHRFNWAALQDERLRRHPWLFEHHPERNVWSWSKTFWMGGFPRRFWGKVQSTHDVRVGRLLLYGAVSYFLSVLLLALILIGISATEQTLALSGSYTGNTVIGPGPLVYRRPFPGRAAPSPPAVSAFDVWCEHLLDAPAQIKAPFIAGLALEVAWPWLTVGALMIFRISMRNRGIKTAHVIRCMIYSGDAAAWTNLICALATFPAVIAALYAQDLPFFYIFTPFMGIVPVMWGAFCYRLYVAYKKYMGFDLPMATIAATQVLLLLALVTAAVCSGWINPFFDIRYWFR
jgi:hypothetical protein